MRSSPLRLPPPGHLKLTAVSMNVTGVILNMTAVILMQTAVVFTLTGVMLKLTGVTAVWIAVKLGRGTARAGSPCDGRGGRPR